MPLANSYLTSDQLDGPEASYPLKVLVCEKCLMVQLPEVATPKSIFSEYLYFSSFSDAMLGKPFRKAENRFSDPQLAPCRAPVHR